jgi:hypothetical protein
MVPASEPTVPSFPDIRRPRVVSRVINQIVPTTTAAV